MRDETTPTAIARSDAADAADDALVDAVVSETGADRRTVIRRLAGLPVRGAAGPAIDRALAARRQRSAR